MHSDIERSGSAGDGNSGGREAGVPPFLAGEGEMGSRIFGASWAAAPCRDPRSAPVWLQTVIRACLRADVPMLIWTLPEHRLLYNDLAIPFVGEAHPDLAIWARGEEVWPAVWSRVAPVIADAVERRAPTHSEPLRLVLGTADGPDERHVRVLCLPVPAGTDGVAAVAAELEDVTASVRSDRRLRALAALRALGDEAGTPDLRRIVEALEQHADDVDAAAIYVYEPHARAAIRRVATTAGALFPERFEGRPRSPLSREALGAVSIVDARALGIDDPGWERSRIAVLPLRASPRTEPQGVCLIRLQAHVPFDDDCAAFLRLAVQHVALALQAALASDAARAGASDVRAHQERPLARASGVATWEWDLSSDVMFWSRELYALLGRSPESTVASWATLLDAIHPDDRARASAAWRTAIEAGREFSAEFRIVRPSGDLRWIVGRGAVMLDASGRPARAIGISLDRTEERRRLEQLQALAAVPVKVQAVGTIESTLDAISAEARAIVGARSARTVLVRGVNDVVVSMVPPAPAGTRPATAGPTSAGIEAIVQRENRLARLTRSDLEADPAWRPAVGSDADLDVPVRGWLAAPLIGSDGRNIGVIQLVDRDEGDFTEADEAMLGQLAGIASAVLEQARLYAEAQEANRLKDEFLATLSHELRTPLNAILGWASLLAGGPVRPELLTRAIDVIVRNAKQQAALIEDILDMSRIVTGRLRLQVEDLELGGLVEAVVDATLPSARQKELTVRTEGLQNLGRLPADEARLQQVLWNLLSNAVKFTPAGGTITIAGERTSDEVAISVRDSGVGIPAEFLPHIFERFRQADASSSREYGGLGLGLSIVQHIVRAHGGRVAAESAGSNAGAVFTVTLPLRPTPAPVSAIDLSGGEGRVPRALQPADLTGIRVLAIDDDPDARELVSQVLSAAGAEVRTAASGLQGLRTFDEWTPQVVLCDLSMPEMDGWEFIRRLRGRPGGTAVPAVALTAFARREDRQRAQREGFRVHLAKPVAPAELIGVVAAFRTGPGDRARRGTTSGG
jgi:signal transduction histidine kinase/ActR/RegA family two-component response regulator